MARRCLRSIPIGSIWVIIMDGDNLNEIMDEIGKNAQAKGLTPDMLESMPREEGFADGR